MAGSDRDGDREKALAAALVQIERQFGKGSVMRLGDEVSAPVEAIPTGSIALDVALGIGGLPRGRVVEIYGPEGGGKTTMALSAIANAQKLGGIAAFIDAEHALDPGYAQKIGVDTDALLVSQPDTGEQALEITDVLIRSGAIDIVVIDSVAALVPRAEIEGEMGDSHVGLQARLMSQALRKLTGAISQTKTTVIFINQLREKIGVLFGCMSYTTRVTLADGSQEKIGKIVNQRMPVKVLSYDPETGTTVPRRVISWFNNGRADKFLQFTVAKSGGNGRAQFAATENHLIRTSGGWRPAGELIPGDRVIVAEPSAQPGFARAGLRPVSAKVTGIHVKPRTRSMNRFDIEVEGLHSYFVDGVMVHNSPETTSGGRALKFYASVRLDVRRIETLKDGTEAVGNRIRVKVLKNKVAPPFRQAEMDLLFGQGISREGGLIDLGVEEGIVRKSGAWYTCEGDQLGQGKENARTFLRDNPDLADGIEKKIKEKLGVAPRPGAEDDAPGGTADDGAGQPGGDK
jgi:RecA/RadA recombinase